MGLDEEGSEDQEAGAESERTQAFRPPPAEAAAPQGGTSNVPLGTVLGYTYRVEELLARGGMGEVYRAVHLELQTQHAIKLIRPEFANDPKIVELFRREAATLRTLRNDAIVAYDGVFRDEAGRLYLVMEFVGGPSLSHVLKERPLEPAEVRRLRDRVASGLAAAHDKGIVHRDISPENIIIPGRQVEHAKIIDFGIAKLADPQTATIIGGEFAGRYLFSSPEQLGMFGSHVDARSDIYSLALVLCAAAIGKPLDMGHSPSTVIERRAAVPDLSSVPEELRAELAHMLEPDPDRRPRSIRELLAAGEDDSSAATVFEPGLRTARQAAAKAKGAGKGRFGRRAAVVAVVLVGLLGGGAALFLASREGEHPVDVSSSKVEGAPSPDKSPQPTPKASEPPPPPVEVKEASGGATQASTPAGSAPPSPPEKAEPVATAVPQVAAKPPFDRPRTQGLVEQTISNYSCANLTPSLAQDGVVSLSGFVATEDDKTLLAPALSKLPGVARVDTAVTVLKWPFCQAELAVAEAAPVGKFDTAAPSIELDNPSRAYRDGDKLVITLKATPRYGGYLYLAFLDGSGDVSHLLWSATAMGSTVTAGEEKKLGTRGELVAAPPYGDNMVIAISSRQPLFATARPQTESATDFLPALKTALAEAAAAGSDRPLASYLFLRVDPPR